MVHDGINFEYKDMLWILIRTISLEDKHFGRCVSVSVSISPVAQTGREER